jgi:hypothetical protein
MSYSIKIRKTGNAIALTRGTPGSGRWHLFETGISMEFDPSLEG